MNRTIWYSEEQLRVFDLLWQAKDDMKAVSRAAQAALGTNNSLLFGLTASQQTVPNLSILLASGQIYQWSAIDGTPYGGLAADANFIYQQGWAESQTLALSTAQMSAGQQQYALVQAQFQQVDSIRVGDPTNGILPYWNSSNPLIPLQGEGGNGEDQPSLRAGSAVLQVIYGNPATTGNAIPPAPTSNWVPLYLVLLSQNQTSITNGQILTCGPNAYTGTGFPSGYPQAPFCPGLTGQLPNNSGSHHGGILGQAAKVLLTNGAEVQGLMSFGNLPASNQSPLGVGGNITLAGVLQAHYQGTGNPNGSVAGQLGDSYFDKTSKFLWECTTAGISSAAVWSQNGVSGQALYVGAFPFTPVAGNTYLCNTPGGGGVCQLPSAAAMGGIGVELINIGTGTLTITPFSGESIALQAANVSVTLNAQEQMLKIWPSNQAGGPAQTTNTWYIG